MPADVPQSPDYWRRRAEQARSLLKHTRNPKIRGYLTEIAVEYDRLAAIAEGKDSDAPPKA